MKKRSAMTIAGGLVAALLAGALALSLGFASTPRLEPRSVALSLSSATLDTSVTRCVKGWKAGTLRRSSTEEKRMSTPPPIASLLPELSCFLLGTSKTLAPGLRVGFLAGPRQAVGTGKFTKVKGSGKWNGTGPSGVCSGVWVADRA